MKKETRLSFQIEHEECAFQYKMNCLHHGYLDFAQSYDELKLVHIIEGSAIWNIGGRDHAVGKDDILLFSRVDERYISQITSPESLLMEEVKFLPMTLHPMQGCADFFFERPQGFCNLLKKDDRLHPYLLNCFAQMREELSADRLYQKEYIVHLLMGMVITAARLNATSELPTSARGDSRYSLVCRITVYIKDHLHEDLSRERLAKRYGISPSYLSRLFTEYSGTCLQDYIVRCRIQKAVSLLKAGKHSVLEAAMESGFASSSGFYRAFRKETGKKPKDFLAGKS